jgi:hypothetical protein
MSYNARAKFEPMRDCLEGSTQISAAVSRRCSLAAIALAIALFCSALPRVAAQNTTHTDATEHIRGIVINSVTREPISHALVFSPDNSFAAMTDDRGRFEFTFTTAEPQQSGTSVTDGFQLNRGFQNPSPSRPSQLMARKVGFVGPNFDQPMNVNAFSDVAPDQQDVVISLLPEARVVGHVIIPGSDGSDKIQVALYRRTTRDGREQWDSAGNATTRADGQFRMAELSPGDYKLLTLEQLDRDPLTAFPRGQLFGYPPLYYPNASDFATAAVIKLTPGETFQATMSPAKRAYYPVHLGLTNPLANGIAVTVWPEGHPGPGYSLGYNPQEAAIQGSMPDGTYTVQARVYGPTMMAGTTNFTVRGAPVAAPAVTLLQGSSVAVSVREEFQHTQAGPGPGIFVSGPTAAPQNTRRPNYLQVNLIPDEEFSLASQVSMRPPANENDESLVIENVLPGRYRVNVTTGLGYVSAITSGSTDLLQKPLVVGAGGAIPALEITVRDDGAELDGTLDYGKVGPGRPALQSLSDGPLGNIYVMPIDKIDSQPKLGYANGDGTFTIQQIAPGTYRVFATDSRQFLMQSLSEEWLKRHESEVQVLRVVAAQKEHLRLSLIAASE